MSRNLCIISTSFAGMSKLEMFARDRADGWDSWGLEVEGCK